MLSAQCDRNSRDVDTAAMPPSQDALLRAIASASTRKSHRWPRLAQHARLPKRASAASDGTLSLKADGGALTGSQMADGSTAEIFDGTVNGNQLSWKVSISDPMPLTLEFNGTVDGDEVTGSVTLGNFGSSSFSGTRN